MTDATVVITSLYIAAAGQLALQLGSVYYAFKLTKVTGTFRAWTLIITAFVFLSVRNLVSLVLTLGIPPAQLVALIDQIGWTTTMVSQLVNIGATFMLLVGVRELFVLFKRQSKKP
jgi:hypothetical protein